MLTSLLSICESLLCFVRVDDLLTLLRLIRKNFDWEPLHLAWELPSSVHNIKTCYNLQQDPVCGAICKWEGDVDRVDVGDKGWGAYEQEFTEEPRIVSLEEKLSKLDWGIEVQP